MEAGAEQLPDDELAPGTLVGGRYRIVHKLAIGGMGVIYRAEELPGGRAVALKMASRTLANDRVLVGRFVREARTVSQLHHPHAVEVLDVLEDEVTGRPVIVMELLEGEELADRLERGPLTIAEAADIFIPVLEALAHAHAKGIVHRDLKPDNIFLARDADGGIQPKVLDFGIAKIVGPSPVDPETMRLTRTGVLLGTPHFMSPEQVSGMGDLDYRTDLWSVGVALYETLAGELPFRGENFGQVFARILQQEPEPLSAYLPDVPDDIEQIVRCCLAKVRSDRPDSCAAVAAVLARHASRPPAAMPEPVAIDPDTGGFDVISEVWGRKPTPRRRRGWLFALLLVGAVAAGLGVALWASGGLGGEEAPAGAASSPRAEEREETAGAIPAPESDTPGPEPDEEAEAEPPADEPQAASPRRRGMARTRGMRTQPPAAADMETPRPAMSASPMSGLIDTL